MGQSGLVDYGIQTDKSDYRVHVGFEGGYIYFFETRKGQMALENSNYELKRGRVPKAEQDTYAGYPVPWENISGCEEIKIPDDLRNKYFPCRGATTYEKGDSAIAITKGMLLRGLIPIRLIAAEVSEKDLQIKGFDLIVSPRFTIQVKCDMKAGRGGTGNLFLQTRERHLKDIQPDKSRL